MKYSIIVKDKKAQGVPIFLNALLTEKFDIKNPMPPMKGYSWTKVGEERIYPEKLFLVSKDRLYKFDYYQFWKGYIISEQFKTILDNHATFKYKCVDLEVIGWKGKKISDKKYYFMDIPSSEWVDAIDYDKSNFVIDDSMVNLRGLNVQEILSTKNYYGNIKTYNSIVIDGNKCGQNDIFRLKDIVLHDLVCSELAFEELNKCFGIRLIEIDKAYQYFPPASYLQSEGS